MSSQHNLNHKKLLLIIVSLFILITIFFGLKEWLFKKIRWMTMTTQERVEDTSSAASLKKDSLAIVDTDNGDLNLQDDSLVTNLQLAYGVDRVNINEALGNIAGVDGSVKWTYDNSPEKYKDKPDLFIAKNHTVGSTDYKNETLDLTILINRSNKRFKIIDAYQNGKRLKGIMLVMTLAIKGGYSQGSGY